MPAIILGIADAARFDVVGSRHEETGIILHVGLMAGEARLEMGRVVQVHDMGPPLNVEPPNTFPVAVHGSLPLTREEREGIDEWLAEILPLASSCKYLASPSARLHRDEITGQIAFWEFSCAGFVAMAYERGADVVLVKQSELPPLSADQAYALWGQGRRREVFARLASLFGLNGEGPWLVLVPGHIFHALQQGRSFLPYRPSATDISFP